MSAQTNDITPHSYYRTIRQRRAMDHIRRRCAYERTGQPPPLQWADEPAEHDETRGVMAWLTAALRGRA